MVHTRTPEYFLLAARRAEIAALLHLAASCRLVTDVCALVHQLQRERGISNVFLASAGERFAAQRLEQVQACITMEQDFRTDLQQLDAGALPAAGNMRLLNRLAWVLHELDRLPAVRQQIADQALNAPDTTQAFSDLIAGLLSVVFEAADIASDPDITRVLVALFNFIQGKEYAGQERAWAAIGFAEGHFSKALCERLRHLRDAQQRCFETFVEFAPVPYRASWHVLEASSNTLEFMRLRQVVMRVDETDALNTGISEIWYSLATARIDSMKEIEDALAAALLEMSEHKVALAREALRDSSSRVQAIAAMKAPAPAPVAVLMESPREPGDVHESVPGKGVHPEIARSIYDMVAHQAEHLRRVSEELEQARRALAERKLMERAKGILMKQRGMSEEDAWRTLRQTAMNSNRSLTQVAESVISMSGLLKKV